MRKILVSECLYGDRIVRYDGKSKEETDPQFKLWKKEGRFITVCPEVFGGLPTPRIDAQRIEDKVITRDGRDVTTEYTKGAKEAVRLAKEMDIVCAILKEGSPACGANEIHDGKFDGKKIPGQGLATQLLREIGIKVFSEKEIKEAAEFISTFDKR